MASIEKTALLPQDHPEEGVFHHKGKEHKGAEKTAEWAYNLFSVVIFPVGFARLTYAGIHWATGKLVLPAQFIGVDSSLRKKFGNELHAKEVSIVTEDGVTLEAMHLTGRKAEKNGPTVILCNPNGALMEHLYEKAYWYKNHGFNVILFNYRGTGLSGGTVTRDGLLKDGEALFAYAKSLTGDTKKIVIDGHSLGGAVAAHIGAKHPGCHALNDRGFGLLSTTIDLLIIRGLGTLAKGISWEFDSVTNWCNITGRRWIVHAPDDGIIHKYASLFHLLGSDFNGHDLAVALDEEMIKREFFFVDRNNLGHYAHNMPLPARVRIALIEEMKKATGLGK